MTNDSPLQLLVVTTYTSGDSWQTCETLEDAEREYLRALRNPETITANIAVVIKSTDYSVNEGTIDFTDHVRGYRLTIQKTHAGPQEDDQ